MYRYIGAAAVHYVTPDQKSPSIIVPLIPFSGVRVFFSGLAMMCKFEILVLMS